MRLKRESGGRILNNPGNNVFDHGKIMEKSWNLFSNFCRNRQSHGCILNIIPVYIRRKLNAKMKQISPTIFIFLNNEINMLNRTFMINQL